MRDLNNDIYNKGVVPGEGSYLKSETYNKVEIDNKIDTGLDGKIDNGSVYGKDEVYNKIEIDSKVSTLDSDKANVTDVYSKDEVYNKTEIDNKIEEINGELPTGLVSSVNGQDGDVVLDSKDIEYTTDVSIGSQLDLINAEIAGLGELYQEGFIKPKGIVTDETELPEGQEGWLYGVETGEEGLLSLYLFLNGSWKLISDMGAGVNLDVYALKDEVYNKEESYNRDEIDSKVDGSIKVSSVNTKVGDVVLTGDDINVSGEPDSIKLSNKITELEDSIANIEPGTGAGGGSDVAQEIQVQKIKFTDGQKTGEFTLENDRVISGEPIYTHDGLDGLVMNNDYNLVNFLVQDNYTGSNTSSNVYIRVNGVATQGFTRKSVQRSTTLFSLYNVKDGDVIKFYFSGNTYGTTDSINEGTDNLECGVTTWVPSGLSTTTNTVSESVNKINKFGFSIESKFYNKVVGVWESVPLTYKGAWQENNLQTTDIGGYNGEYFTLGNNFSNNCYEIKALAIIGFNPNAWVNTSFRVVAVPEGSEAEVQLDAFSFTNAILLEEITVNATSGNRIYSLNGVDLNNFDLLGNSRNGYRIYVQCKTSNIDNEYIDNNVFRMEVMVRSK